MPHIGASEVGDLMNGDFPAVYAKMEGGGRLTEHESAARLAAKLRAVGARPNEGNLRLAARIGTALEPIHVQWFEEETGLLVLDQQTVLRLDGYPLRATLDGRVRLPDQSLVPWEAKTTGASQRTAELLPRYAPQLQAQMLCTGAKVAVLSILWRTPKWEAFVVEACAVTQAELLDRLELFRSFFESATPPPQMPAAVVPAPIVHSLADYVTRLTTPALENTDA